MDQNESFFDLSHSLHQLGWASPYARECELETPKPKLSNSCCYLSVMCWSWCRSAELHIHVQLFTQHLSMILGFDLDGMSIF